MALQSLTVERFRGIRSARVTFDPATVLFGENGSGKSSVLEAMALVLSPFGGRRPRFEAWHFHREQPSADSPIAGPIEITLTLVETLPGSWDRPALAPLRAVIGPANDHPRTLTLQFVGVPGAEGSAVDARWEIRGLDDACLRDDEEALAAVRGMNPLVWLRGASVVRPPASADVAETSASAGTALPDWASVVASYERLVAGASPSEDAEIEAGYAAAERLLATWAPSALSRGPLVRSAVTEVLGRQLVDADVPDAELGHDGPALAGKLGVFLLTARLFQHLRNAAPGVRPIIVIEDLESGLHPMTLASAWSLLERLSTQKIVTTNSGSLLAAAPLSALRRLERDEGGVVREWRVPEGALGRGDLRRISYHLRARRGAACFARCWLLVEGETEFWVLPDLARLCGYDFAQVGVACVEFAQCGIRPLVRLARALGIEWHVLADGDRAGASYAQSAHDLSREDDGDTRVTMLAERDVEHCFWKYGYADVFRRLAGLPPGAGGDVPRRVIERAVARHSKPGVAFELLGAVAEPGSPGPPPPLLRTIEKCVALAHS